MDSMTLTDHLVPWTVKNREVCLTGLLWGKFRHSVSGGFPEASDREVFTLEGFLVSMDVVLVAVWDECVFRS